jgi:phospholipase/lecithinase/hemolysin
MLQFTLGLLLATSTALSAPGGFSSLYVFGDTLSATADPTDSLGPPYYYGYRFSNGRVWVEVLAQRQGVAIPYNNSYYDHNSTLTLADVNSLNLPSDVANGLFVVWVCNADTFDAATAVANSSSPDAGTLLNIFKNANIQSQANHLQIITKLYAKGVRTLVMPNAVDISVIPAYNQGNATAVLHAGCIDYNARFNNTISQAKALCPGLNIYTPDFYTLLNSVLANPGFYGLSNVLAGGYSMDAIGNYSPSIPPLNGAANNYIFWDQQDPTAKFHAIIADVAQQLISPVQISRLKVFNGSNRLDVVNLPVGLSGFVLGCTNLSVGGWTSVTNFDSTSVNQSLFVNAAPLPPSVPASGTGGNGSIDPNNTNNVGTTYVPPFNPAQFYQLQFPFAWSWP